MESVRKNGEKRGREHKKKRIVTRDSHNLGRKKYYEESEKEEKREKRVRKRDERF